MKYTLAAFFTLLICFAVPFGSSAQILNDSTQNIYSPKTTRILNEERIFRGNYDLSQVDTTLNNLQQQRNWYHDTTFYQDLGNLATPAKRLFWSGPTQIGARYGRNIFDRYNYNPANQLYFDTKSPYSRLNYVQGGNGQQVFDGTFSRNINKNANVGFTYERISSEKFYGSANIRGSREVERTGLTLFTHLQTNENRYHLFANFNYAEHAMLESGGIQRDTAENGTIESIDSLYITDQVQVLLNTASNREYRKNVHVSQVLRIAKEHLKVYHTFDYRSQFNRFKDNALTVNTNPTTKISTLYYYPTALYDSARTSQSGEFRSLENTLGIMSDSKLHFFRGYVKQRNFKYRNAILDVERATDPDSVMVGLDQDTTQYFVGGTTEFKFRDIFNITAQGEYQLFKDYRLEAAVRLKFLTVSQSRTSFSPTFSQLRASIKAFTSKWSINWRSRLSPFRMCLLSSTTYSSGRLRPSS